mmetsp:Transcript_64831/g.204702  ORF Transcript_64831/g.204702 Transcript_64831/m.204702 type:complete len:226 (+) Transcript_64831:578-1255(+)
MRAWRRGPTGLFMMGAHTSPSAPLAAFSWKSRGPRHSLRCPPNCIPRRKHSLPQNLAEPHPPQRTSASPPPEAVLRQKEQVASPSGSALYCATHLCSCISSCGLATPTSPFSSSPTVPLAMASLARTSRRRLWALLMGYSCEPSSRASSPMVAFASFARTGAWRGYASSVCWAGPSAFSTAATVLETRSAITAFLNLLRSSSGRGPAASSRLLLSGTPSASIFWI